DRLVFGNELAVPGRRDQRRTVLSDLGAGLRNLGVDFLGFAPARRTGDLCRTANRPRLDGQHAGQHQPIRCRNPAQASSFEPISSVGGLGRHGLPGQSGHAVRLVLLFRRRLLRHGCLDGAVSLRWSFSFWLRLCRLFLHSGAEILPSAATVASSRQVRSESPSTAAAIWATSSSAREAGAPVNLAKWIIDTNSRTHAKLLNRSS